MTVELPPLEVTRQIEIGISGVEIERRHRGCAVDDDELVGAVDARGRGGLAGQVDLVADAKAAEGRAKLAGGAGGALTCKVALSPEKVTLPAERCGRHQRRARVDFGERRSHRLALLEDQRAAAGFDRSGIR